MAWSFRSPLVRSKDIEPPNEAKSFQATGPEARIFLEGLIDGYANNFSTQTNQEAFSAYNTIAQLNTIIDLIANSTIRARKILYKIDKVGGRTEITSGPMYDLLRKPHFLQAENEFWNTVVINWKLYGAASTYKKKSTGFGVQSMLALPTVNLTIQAKDDYNILKVKDITELIDYYELEQDSKTTKITDPSTIWNLQDESLTLNNDGYLRPQNPLSAIESTLGTLVIIADIKNELLGNHGAMGIINPDGKDADGETVPLLKGEKEELQKAYEDYGIKKGKYKLLITNNSVKFTSISLKIAELLLEEFEAKAEKTLATYFQIPVTYFSDQSKYQDKSVGDTELFESNIIPNSETLTDSFNSSFGLTEQGMELVFDYSHISFLQKDKKEAATTNKLDSSNIISLNQAVSKQEMTRDSAIETLISQGRSEEDAKKLINEPIKKEVTNI